LRVVQCLEADPSGVGLSAYLEAPVRRTVVALSGALVALLAASGCSGAQGDQDAPERPGKSPTRLLDDPGLKACNSFARWLAGDEDPATRRTVALKVYKQASESKSGELSGKAEVLARPQVISSNDNWALAADSFASECFDQGWTAADAK